MRCLFTVCFLICLTAPVKAQCFNGVCRPIPTPMATPATGAIAGGPVIAAPVRQTVYEPVRRPLVEFVDRFAPRRPLFGRLRGCR